MLKILHTSDLHFNKRHFEWIVSQQENYDLFCITGDFLDELQDDVQEQIIWVRSWIKAFVKPLFVCTGNHDVSIEGNENWLNEINTKNYYCDGMRKSIEGTLFLSAPYENYDGFDDCDVLLNHLPPAKTKTALTKDGEDWGDRELYRALKNGLIKPKIILSGHIHSPQKQVDSLFGTTVYNPGLTTNKDIPFHHNITINT